MQAGEDLGDILVRLPLYTHEQSFDEILQSIPAWYCLRR